MDPADAAGARMLGVDVGRAERVVWLVKVPAFVSGQWQALPLLQERATARARAEPVLVQVITAALRSLHSSSELAAGWDNARKADDFQRLLRDLDKAGSVPAGVLPPPGTGSQRDLLSSLVPALRLCVAAETRVALAATGRPRTRRLSEAACASLVSSGCLLCQAALGAAAATLVTQRPEERSSTITDDAALKRVATDALRAVVAAHVPSARIASGAIEADLEPCEDVASSNAVVGRVRMSYNPCAEPAQPAEFNLTLCGTSAEGLPREYGLRRVADALPTHIFGEPASQRHASQSGGASLYLPLQAQTAKGGVVGVDGIVDRRLDMHLTDASDAEYRRLNRARMVAANTKTRVTMAVATFTTVAAPSADAGGVIKRKAEPQEEAIPLQGPLPKRANRVVPLIPKEAKHVATLDADQLQAQLFDLFEARSSWKMADLSTRTGQPVALLKEVLAGIAQMDKTPGPTRGCYQLLPHLRRPAAATTT